MKIRKEKSCGTIVINEWQQVLIIKQNNGFYGFPKGHVEGNETNQQTAIRETKEETNIDVSIINDDGFSINYITNNIDKTVIYFLAEPLSMNLKKQASEISQVLWVDLVEVENILTYANLKKLWHKKILPNIENK